MKETTENTDLPAKALAQAGKTLYLSGEVFPRTQIQKRRKYEI